MVRQPSTSFLEMNFLDPSSKKKPETDTPTPRAKAFSGHCSMAVASIEFASARACSAF